MAGFNSFNRARGFQRPAPQAPVKAAASAMAITFPGARITSAQVIVFGNDPTAPAAECHVTVTGNMGNALFTAEVGRYDPQAGSGRLILGSVQDWANALGLEYSHEDEPTTNRAGETYVVIYLKGKNAQRANIFTVAEPEGDDA